MKATYFAQQQIDEILTFLKQNSPEQSPKDLVDIVEFLLLDKIRACIPLSKNELGFFDIEEVTLDSAA